MSNNTVVAAFDIARSLLGDDIGNVWTDPVLFPKLIQAHSELVAKLVLNGLSVQVKASDQLLLTQGDTSLGVLEPSDIIRIISVKELAPSADISTATSMRRVDILPKRNAEPFLGEWCYDGESLTFVGATQNRNVIINYFREPSAPTDVNSPLDFKLSEIYLGPRIAALCSITKDPTLFERANQMADANLSSIVRIQVKGDQSLPVRRRPFSFANRRGTRII